MAGTSLNADNVLIPGRGTVITAPVGTAPVAVATFDYYTPATFAGWDLLGHTSRENPPSWSKDGGEQESKDSWEEESLASSTSPTTFGLAFNALEVTRETMDLTFPGGTYDSDEESYSVGGNTGKVEKAVQVLMLDGGKIASIYHPRVSLSGGDMWEIDVENFFETNLAGTIMTYNGERFRVFPPRTRTEFGA